MKLRLLALLLLSGTGPLPLRLCAQDAVKLSLEPATIALKAGGGQPSVDIAETFGVYAVEPR